MYIGHQSRSARVRRRGDAPLRRWYGDRLRRSRLRERRATRRARHASFRRDPADFFRHCAVLDRVYTASDYYRRQEAGGRHPPATCPLLPATLICGQPIRVARRSLRAELAKEEYATTWQEEEQGEPQEERVGRPKIRRRPQRKALDPVARGAEDNCAKERGAEEYGSKGRSSKGSSSKGSGQTERDEPQGFAGSAPRGSSVGGRSQ